MVNKQHAEDILSPLQRAAIALQEARNRIEALERVSNEPIAIIGIGCRFPGGINTPDEFWKSLMNKSDMISEVPSDRWDIESYYAKDTDISGKMSTRFGGFVDHIDYFDPQFFGISPREAVHLDPQQRMLLEVTWEAFEYAGQPLDSLQGSQTGVFIGISINEYMQVIKSALGNDFDAYVGTGTALSAAAGRLAYNFGFHGPCMAIDTACSSSLVALHVACQSLRHGECSQAVVGGVNTLLLPDGNIGASKARMLAPDGRCKTFDQRADGYVRSEGCGVVILKRLSDASSAGDSILAVIRGSAVQQDGSSSGLTVPNSQAQQHVIRQALLAAGVRPEQISYIEAHGTGTSLGDPIEISALNHVFQQSHRSTHPLWIGSVKTNIGHLESAAGIAGLIKVVLSLQHGVIPALLHFQHLNDRIDLSQIPAKLPTEHIPWLTQDQPRIAGVSSFGFTGTIAHVIVEQAPVTPSKAYVEHSTHHVLCLSAKNTSALCDLIGRYEQYLDQNPETSLSNLCWSANTGRVHFQHRLAMVTESISMLRTQLRELGQGLNSQGIWRSAETERTAAPKVAFVFTGQGSQYPGMAASLYASSAVFRTALDAVVAQFDPLLPQPLGPLLLDPATSAASLEQTELAQPALFALGVALTALWRACGVTPTLVLGHSLGEYLAATLAGVLSLPDAVRVVAARARLMQALPADGSMVRLTATAADLQPLLASFPRLSIAAYNAPSEVVVAGPTADVTIFTHQAQQAGYGYRQLAVSHAFHSGLMEPMQADFAAVAAQVTWHAPRIPLISNQTGTFADATIAAAGYWVEHIRAPVQFARSLATAAAAGCTHWIELGPKPALSTLIRATFGETAVVLPSLRPADTTTHTFLSSLARLYSDGVPIQWKNVSQPVDQQRLVLPAYPFQHERYWVQEHSRPHSFANQNQSEQDYPFLGQCLPLPGSDEIRFNTVFSHGFPGYLQHHRIFNTIVVPGASHIAMIVAAAEHVFASELCIIENILFPQALTITDNTLRNIQVVLTPQATNVWAVRVMSCLITKDTQEEWVTHATAVIKAYNSIPAQPVDYQPIVQRCPDHQVGATVYQEIQAIGFNLGNAFQWMEHLWQGVGESVGQLSQPILPDTREDYPIYPGLLDSCFQVFSNCLNMNVTENQEPSVIIPFAIERMIVHRRPTDNLWCVATKYDHAKGTSGEIRLVDKDGSVLVEFHGASGRRATPLSLMPDKQPEDCLYMLDWQPVTVSKIPLQPRSWLICSHEPQDGYDLARALENQGHQCHHVVVNALSTPQAWVSMIRDWRINTVSGMEGIIIIGPSVNKANSDRIDHIEDTYERYIVPMLYLAQAMVNESLHNVSLWVITQGIIHEQTPAVLAQLAGRGLIKTLDLEQPGLIGGVIDLDQRLSFDERWKYCCQLLQLSANGESYAVTPAKVLVERLMPYHPQIRSTPLIRDDRTYLISGGLSGLGFETACWLAQQGARQLVLLGRRQPGVDIQNRIMALENGGTQITCINIDIAKQDELEQLWTTTLAQLPPLAGVIHAAGIIDDGVIVHQSAERFHQVAQAKVQGSWNLHQLTLDLELDFFIMYSSAAAVLGSPGQANYATANAFMDGLAAYRQAIGLSALSINWGPWAKVGMAASLESKNETEHFISAIEPQQGLNILARLIGQNQSQIAVLPINWANWPESLSKPLFAHVLQRRTHQQTTHPHKINLINIPIQQRLDTLFISLQLKIAHSLRLPIEQLNRYEALPDFGLDSLMAVEIKNYIETTYAVNVPIMTIIEGISLEQLTQLVYDQFHLNIIEELSEQDIDYLMSTLLPSTAITEV